jgi:hypothetical protein
MTGATPGSGKLRRRAMQHDRASNGNESMTTFRYAARWLGIALALVFVAMTGTARAQTAFSNEQLAQMGQKQVNSKAGLKEIAGVGDARVEKGQKK